MLDALNNQIKLEAESSQIYLGMASWAEVKGLNGIADFLYEHADEERMHMLKLIRYVKRAWRKSLLFRRWLALRNEYKDVREVFETFLAHEIEVFGATSMILLVWLFQKEIIPLTISFNGMLPSR